MRRSSLTLWLSLVGGLLGVQCLDPLSDDCTKTLTCGDEARAALGPDCKWRFPDGGIWTAGPQRNAQNRWVWPDGTETVTQDYACDADAGSVDAGANEPDCTIASVGCDAPLRCNDVSKRCVECFANSHCTDGEVCDLEAQRCVECLGRGDCTAPGVVGPCRRDPEDSRNNKCVECEAASGATDCSAGEVCDDAAGECTLQCNGSASDRCPEDKPECNLTRGVCVECNVHTDCAGNADRTQCDPDTNLCVACVDNAPCVAPNGVCDTANNVCVRCNSNDQCEGATGQCNLSDHTCVACLNDGQCTGVAQSRCNLVTHTCDICTDESQCQTTLGEAPHCRFDDGRCVECLNTADCAGEPLNERLCEVASGVCVQCLENTDCTTGGAAASRCANNQCGPCAVDADCNEVPGLPACKTGVGAHCVECTENPDCTDSTRSVCKTVAGDGVAAVDTCVECVADADCRAAGRSNCVNNECAPCAVDTDCRHIVGPPNNSAFICDAPAGGCVQCKSDDFARCTVNGVPRVCDSRGDAPPVCSTTISPGATNACGPCIADAQCADGRLCVQQTFGVANAPVEDVAPDGTIVTTFCFTRVADDICPISGRPFTSLKNNAVSIDGVVGDVCGLALTTCPALGDFREGKVCTTDPDCGAVPFADGLCNPSGGCTVPCGGNGGNCENVCSDTSPSFCQ